MKFSKSVFCASMASVLCVTAGGAFAQSTTVRPKVTGPMPNCIITPEDPRCKVTVQAESSSALLPLGTIVQFAGMVDVNDPLGASNLDRGLLDPRQGWGSRFPGGFQGPPDGSNPDNLRGGHWPFRDFLNFEGEPPAIPGGNNDAFGNGSPDGGIFAVNLRQDYQRFGVRGNPFDGSNGVMNLYEVEVLVTDFTPRIIEIDWIPAESPFLVLSAGGDEFIPSVLPTQRLFIQVVPAPGAAAGLLMAGVFASRRRRNSSAVH